MLAASSAGIGSAVLHYLAPIITAVYFVSAKTTAVCLLQEPDRGTGTKSRRYPAIALQLIAVSTAVAEAISTILHAIRQPGWAATQDYIVYLLVFCAVHSCLVLGLSETPTPLWHPYFGAWLVALAFEATLLSLAAVSIDSGDGYTSMRLGLAGTRALALLLLCLGVLWFALRDRMRCVKLDDESEALLDANGNGDLNGDNTNGHLNGSTVKPLRPPTSTTTHEEGEDSDEADMDSDFDSESEEPERDKELKALQRKRLQESGSWLNYLREFKIFIPMLLPWKDRLVQFCFVVIGVIMVAERVLQILKPRQLGIIVDELTATAGSGEIQWRSIGLWVLYTSLSSGAGLSLIKAVAQIPVQQYGYKAISTTAFRHIMILSMDFHSEKNSGELIRAIGQGTNLQDLVDFIFFDVTPMFFDLIVAFVYVAVLFDIYMSLILFAVGTSYIFIGAKLTTWSIKRRRDFNAAWRLESKVQNEAINNWQTVSHFNRGEYESNRYSNTVDAYNLAEWKYYLAYYLGGGAQSFIMLVGRLAITVLAIWRVARGQAPVGKLITLISYWGSIEGPLSNVSYSVRKISQMLTDSERLLQLLTTKPSVTDAPGAPDINVTAGEVVFDDVDFSYDIRKPTLKGVSFSVKPGQTVAFVGETGGGKSTILKMLYRYYDVAEGAIRIDGQDIRSVTLDSLRDAFGMVPQDPSLFNITIMENIKYARLDATDEEVHDACRAAAIHDKIMTFPDGYKAMVGERGVKLSGGELQRVSIARAILRQPKIVLLDEATSMIDAETEAVIQEAFKRLTAHRTTFIVAHRLSTIQHADLILVVNDGQIIERGTHEELFRQKGKYVALWSKQLSKDVKDIGTTLDVTVDDEPLVKVRSDEEE
jgi:ABC-type transport system involved in Fe-S cluster assembly fused permease/ATPase subunit